MTVVNGTKGTITGPPRICEKCRRGQFERLIWPNRDGTTELAYACRGCGRVYEPVPIDMMANLRKALEDREFAAMLAASAVSSSRQSIMRQYADEEVRQYAERARAGDMATAFAYAAQAAASFSEEIDAPAPPRRDPYRRENWRAMERRHGRRWKGRR